MAKTSMIEKGKKRERLVKNKKARRAELKAVIMDKAAPIEQRFEATLKLAAMPRNSSKTRLRNRCLETGRPRATYRRFKLARVMLRDLASFGQIPGLTKSSW